MIIQGDKSFVPNSQFENRVNNNSNKSSSSFILKLPNVIIQELFLHFFSLQEISNFSLLNKKFRIQAESPVLWNRLCDKFIKNNVANHFKYLQNDSNAKRTVIDIYKNEIQRYPFTIFDDYRTYGKYSELIRYIFGGIESLMALPLIALDNKSFDKTRYHNPLRSNPHLVEALRQAPSVCKICTSKKPTLSKSVWIAIQLDAYIKNPTSINKEDRTVIPGVCVLGAYNDTINLFSFLTKESTVSQEKLNPECLHVLSTKYHAQWFQRLLNGEKCGQIIPNWIPNGCDGDGEWDEIQYCNESCEEMYFMLRPNQPVNKIDEES